MNPLPTTAKFLPAKMIIRKALLTCGILYSLLYIATDILASIQYEGFSYAAQGISELQAIGAPTREFFVLLNIINSVLITAFGFGIRVVDTRMRAHITGMLIVLYAIIGFVTLLFFPMHMRGDDKTITDTMHIVFTGINGLIILLSMGFGATLHGKGFRIYSIGTIVIVLLFGVVAGMDGPRVAAQLPTPWLGITERILIFSYMLWVLVQAIIFLRAEKGMARDPGCAYGRPYAL